MAAPPKPWEMAGVNGRIGMDNVMQTNSAPAALGQPLHTSFSTGPSVTPPALPPRPYARNSFGSTPSYMPYGGGGGGFGSGYNSFGSGYGGYSGGYGSGYGSSYGGYGGFGGMGSQGYGNFYGGYNRMSGNMYGDVESRFIQMAEESSRPTFNSIESVVGAVGSVAMMLENTFFAMTSSFRAILGVAENFGRLRTLFAQFWSAFAIFRAFNWLVKKLLVLLGIRTEEEFKAWAEATKQTRGDGEAAVGGPSGKTSSWPAILFLAVIGAVPYIIVKMLGSINASIQSNASDPKSWQNSMQAIAQYDFQASSTQELSFGAHQIITIAPQELQGNLWNSGWLLASVDQKTSGLVPVNYFKIIKNQFSSAPQQTNLPSLPPIPENNGGLEQNLKPENILQSVVSNVEPIVDKLDTCSNIAKSD